jgi:hypothetical protein
MSKEIKDLQAKIGGTRPQEITCTRAQTPQHKQTALDWTRFMALPRGNTPDPQFPQTPRNREV